MSDRKAQPASPAIIVLTDRLLFPCRVGGSARIVELIHALRSRGFTVVLIGCTLLWRGSWRPGFRSMVRTRRLVDGFIPVRGPTFGIGSPFDWDPGRYAAALGSAVERFRPVAVIAEYLWMAPCLDVVPRGILRFLDTLDLMHVRRSLYAGVPGTGGWVDVTPREELLLLGKADVVIAIQAEELAEFRRMLPEKRIILVPHSLPPRRFADPVPSTGEVVAFVGSANEGNLEGLRRFLGDAWPVVRAARPGAELRVYGGVTDWLGESAAGLRKIGGVRDVWTAYRAATVVINPVTLGTGLKIKTVEALASGRALVTTSCGAAGLLEGAGQAFLVEDDAEGFGRAVARLLGDPAGRRILETRAVEFARERFDRTNALAEFLEVLGPVSNRGPASI